MDYYIFTIGIIPSDTGIDLTDRLMQAGKIINITVADHLIITERTYMSFGNTGRMKEPEESTNWVPAYSLIVRIKKQEAELRKEVVKIAKEKGEKTGHKKGIAEGEKQKAIAMAKQMKQNYKPIEKIISYTGFTKAEIDKL